MADTKEHLSDFLREELIEIHAMLNLIYDYQALLLIRSLNTPKEQHEEVSRRTLETYRKDHRDRVTQRWEQSKK